MDFFWRFRLDYTENVSTFLVNLVVRFELDSV